ncbi:acetylhydrolase [Sphingomonas oligophenolica]|uniref:Dienelactone hydrolase n=1 Tax=Sphingomonas oligophenolica TaxID=301154 RepID=A0ABU9Y0R4_9SPHN
MKHLLLAVSLALVAARAAPAVATPATNGPVCEAQWQDPARGNRIVPVRIRMPAGTGKVPVILFSHGLGGSLDAGTIWAEAWVRDGNAVIHLQHAGSDSSIIANGTFRSAMSAQQLEARTRDVHFVLDALATRRREGACDLSRIDLARIGMSGHSFGAQTTLAIAGTHYPQARLQPFDRRVKAAIAFSPQPSIGVPDSVAFSGITMPFFSVTGTRDELPWLNKVTAEDRQRPFRAMPAGGKYLLVLAGANHGIFSGQGRAGFGNTASVTHVHAVVIEATRLFWRATLHGDTAAQAVLDRFAATLPAGDSFARK